MTHRRSILQAHVHDWTLFLHIASPASTHPTLTSVGQRPAPHTSANTALRHKLDIYEKANTVELVSWAFFSSYINNTCDLTINPINHGARSGRRARPPGREGGAASQLQRGVATGRTGGRAESCPCCNGAAATPPANAASMAAVEATRATAGTAELSSPGNFPHSCFVQGVEGGRVWPLRFPRRPRNNHTR